MSLKRARLVSETSFNTQATEAEDDLVGAEQDALGLGDRNTNGVMTKTTRMPKKVGAFRGTKLSLALKTERFLSRIMPKAKWTLIWNDLNINSALGGSQMVFDSKNYLSRASTALDTYNAQDNQIMTITSMTMFRNIYQKMLNNANYSIDQSGAGVTVNTIVPSAFTENSLPGLFISGFETTKIFTNVGTNTIVLELWDMKCSNDTDMSPINAWTKDLDSDYGPYGMYKNNIAPLNSGSMGIMGDPGYRPNMNRDKILKEHWECIRKQRYLLRAGQSIHHKVKLPSTELSHTQLYGAAHQGGTTETMTYKDSISLETLAFCMGEIAYDATVGSQKIAPSSIYLQGRCTWELSAQVAYKGRKSFDLVALYPGIDDTSGFRSEYYPTITNANQRIVSQNVVPTPIEVKNLDTI